MEPSYEGNLTESEDYNVFHDNYVLIDVSPEDLACFPEYENIDNLISSQPKSQISVDTPKKNTTVEATYLPKPQPESQIATDKQYNPVEQHINLVENHSSPDCLEPIIQQETSIGILPSNPKSTPRQAT